jgi:hypothetical protein
MAGDDLIQMIYYDWDEKPEGLDAPSQRLDLLDGVRPRISGI